MESAWSVRIFDALSVRPVERILRGARGGEVSGSRRWAHRGRLVPNVERLQSQAVVMRRGLALLGSLEKAGKRRRAAAELLRTGERLAGPTRPYFIHNNDHLSRVILRQPGKARLVRVAANLRANKSSPRWPLSARRPC